MTQMSANISPSLFLVSVLRHPNCILLYGKMTPAAAAEERLVHPPRQQLVLHPHPQALVPMMAHGQTHVYQAGLAHPPHVSPTTIGAQQLHPTR